MPQEDPAGTAGLYDDIDFSVLLQIAGRMIAQHVEAIGKEVGQPAGHLSLLGMVHRKPGLSQNLYSEILAINDATLARYADRLVRDGLLVRQRDTADRRTVQLHLTESGEALVVDVKLQLEKVRGDIQKRLPRQRLKRMENDLIAFLSSGGLD